MTKIHAEKIQDIAAQIKTLQEKLKTLQSRTYKLGQVVMEREKLIVKLREQLKSIDKPVDTVIEQLKSENRELRAKVLSMTDESTAAAKAMAVLKAERDNALEQLKKYVSSKT